MRSAKQVGLRATLGVGLSLVVAMWAAACVHDKATLVETAPEDCPDGQTRCADACVDTTFHPENCGACGQTCPQGELCSQSQCSTECLGGSTQCGDVCVDTAVDPNNCGACDNTCSGGEQCAGGNCSTVCGGGNLFCGGSCVDVTTSAAHCGACDAPCGSTQLCNNSACQDATSCLAILNINPSAPDGVYNIDPDGGGALPAVSTYCDMTTDGGGWTLLAKTVIAGLTAAEQMTLRESFWVDYTDTGYGEPAPASRLYWMPLKYWRELTVLHPSNLFWQKSEQTNMVRVQNLSISDAIGGYAWAWTGTESGFLGITNGLNGSGFTARDVDNDTWPNNCSVDNIGLNGGFWYSSCNQLSMLHVNGNTYRLDSNASTALEFSELYLR